MSPLTLTDYQKPEIGPYPAITDIGGVIVSTDEIEEIMSLYIEGLRKLRSNGDITDTGFHALFYPIIAMQTRINAIDVYVNT